MEKTQRRSNVKEDILAGNAVLYVDNGADWAVLYTNDEAVMAGHPSDVHERIVETLLDVQYVDYGSGWEAGVPDVEDLKAIAK